MKKTLSALAAGMLFGSGLILSEMVNPARVKGFLAITGNWDPTLIFVISGALVATAIGYRLIFKRKAPLFSPRFDIPKTKVIDKRLITGAVVFGVGWGLTGLCPGPALVAIATFKFEIVVFTAAMLAGIKLFEWFDRAK